MDTPTIIAICAVIGLLLNLGLNIYSGGWNLSDKLAKMQIELRTAIDAAVTEIENRQDKASREVGESLSALRQRITEVDMAQSEARHSFEKWARDQFVRRDSFLAMIGEVKGGIASLGDRIEKRLERMETKIDEKT